MTRDVMRLAREAGIENWWDKANADQPSYEAALKRFAALVAAAERERLAMAAESRTDGWCSLTAAEIRARGEK